MNTKRSNIIKTVELAMLVALSVVLMLVVRFPLIPTASFLEYDMGDVPVLISSFLFGPIHGFVVLVIESLIQALTVSSSSGWVGFVMHVCSSGVFIIAASLIYKKLKSVKGLIIGVIVGSVVMTLMMIPLNLIFTVHFLGTPREVVVDMLIPAIIPFNLFKAVLNSVVSAITFVPLQKILIKSKLLPQ
ncbi:MAG: ECF transporter S component [Clostridia bacterium]|nr:ECF transporter S component [Clostridia bacterium]